MKYYQERVLQEKNELDEKLGKLIGFIQGNGFDSVDNGEQRRLRRQQYIMELYSDVLNDRIKAF